MEHYELPDPEEHIENLADMSLLELNGYHVSEWHPLPNGEGKPTQVHPLLEIEEMDDCKLVMRFKSKPELNRFILALVRHRDGVWE